MSTITKPLLAEKFSTAFLDQHLMPWPMLCSPKLDGIRALNHANLGPVTRSFIPVVNHHIRETVEFLLQGRGLDGELVALDENGVADFNRTQSAVMSRNGQPDFEFRVFDNFEVPEVPFVARLQAAALDVKTIGHKNIVMVPHKLIFNNDEFLEFHLENVAAGHEGTMLRSPTGVYKSGRSTLKQAILLKFKDWSDAEGTVIGFEELMHNTNEDVRDKLGHAKRSSAKAGMVPGGTLGKLILDTEWGELRTGSGLDDALRQELWNRNMTAYTKYVTDPEDTALMRNVWYVRENAPDLGRKATFKYQTFGMKDKPRFPIFKHFREDE